ncbi:unnamed protein product [Cuscuta epithymum]|nr:unnamed protein product [Cuscuta epithymum]CAH9136314.1 unnamed protein product [Cuscuta epithymum]
MIDVHRRKPDERELIILNANGQPIGPTRECVTKFSRFLGTLAKSPHLAPLNCASWIYMPTKEKIWKYVKERYIIAEEGKKWVLETTNALWRVHKSRFKKEHYNSFETDEERLAFRPKNIPVKQFEELLEYWDSDMSKEICDKNTKSCALRSDVHTMGPSSYALLRHELQQNDQNNQAPTQAKVYKESRKRDPKRVYKSNSEKTLQNIEAINVQESQHDKEAESNSLKDAYCEVVDNGHLRLYGRGATKSKLNKKSKVAAPSYICPPEFFQSIKENLIRELAPVLTSAVVSQIQAANPGIQLKVPEIFVASEDTPCARSCLFKDNENSDSESID